jgi:hypothetical protein
MADDLLSDLDTRFGSGPALVPVPRIARKPAATAMPDTPVPDVNSRRTFRERLPWLLLFLGAQFLWGALLFVPGAQAYRPIIRALPYALSAGLFVVYVMRIVRGRSPRGTVLLTLALALLAANLMHPTSQIGAGVAQCIFQATIAAPMFWGWKAVDSAAQLRRLLVIAFVFNTIGAALGVLQVYFPTQFMPPELSSLGTRMNDMYVESLTYVGADGERIIRPPGLSDQPGGAATAGALTVVLGAGLSIAAGSSLVRTLTLCATAVGLAAIYLTQVRSLLLMSVAALAMMAVLLFRRGQVVAAGRIALSAAVLVIVAFFWARSLGGVSVEERFIGITQQGAMRSYQENRGGFVSETFGDLLDTYPLGAGLGRWGMMQIYFANPDKVESAPIYVEIQLTGWLLDGGVPMWVFYGGAVLMSLLASYRLSVRKRQPELASLALIVFCVQVLIAGFGWAGPVFNTQLGILFWFLASSLHGAARGETPEIAGRLR